MFLVVEEGGCETYFLISVLHPWALGLDMEKRLLEVKYISKIYKPIDIC